MATITICSDFGAPQNDDKCTYSQSYAFSSSHAWMWELDHKQAECQRTDAFTLWCWSKFLRVPLAARRSNLSILKEITLNIHWKDWWQSWNSSTLATWCKEPTHWKRVWCWERLRAGGEGGDREWDGWMATQTQWTWIWVNWETVKNREACDSCSHKESDGLSDWTTTTE